MLMSALRGGTALVMLGVLSMAPSIAPPVAAANSTEPGRQVFQANCAMCHGTDASGMMGMHPSPRGAVDRLTREGVEVTVRNGRATNPPMPAFAGRLTDREIDHVIAYIESLPTGPRNFGPDTGRGGMGGMMGGSPTWADWLLPALLILGIMVTVGVSILRRRGQSPTGTPTPRDILDQRYARGDLTREEYLERRADLEDP